MALIMLSAAAMSALLPPTASPTCALFLLPLVLLLSPLFALLPPSPTLLSRAPEEEPVCVCTLAWTWS
jgi:hypothetical protein